MSPLKFIALALGALTFVSLVAVSGPTKSASAQEPTPNSVTIVKVCEEGVTGPFDVTFDAEINWTRDDNDINDGEPWAADGFDVDTDFDEAFSIDCGDEVVLEGDFFNNEDGGCPPDGDGTQASEELDLLVCFLAEEFNQYDDVEDPSTATIVEDAVPGVITEYAGNGCNIDLIDDSDGGSQDTYRDEGLICTITNSADEEAIPNLTITKVCLTGDGDGDADFNVTVKDDLGAIVDFDQLDCGEVMVVPDLEPGLYQIQELITGPAADDFVTAIICTTAAGQVVTPGSLAQVELEFDEDVSCQIVNAFQDPGDPAAPPAPCNCAPTVIVPIDIDNTNTNTLNNDNINDNNNVNTNTQEQDNFQEQTNDNNQTTTVNSSPSVVIDFD